MITNQVQSIFTILMTVLISVPSSETILSERPSYSKEYRYSRTTHLNQSDTSTTLHFKEFSIQIFPSLDQDENKLNEPISNDTIEIFARLGEMHGAQHIRISNREFSNWKLEQRYETSVSISNEGPHCDLTNWKHFYSKWELLKPTSIEPFICSFDTEQDSEEFPRIEIEELKQKVKEQCGDEWFILIKDIKSPNEYPSRVGISRYFLRITGQREDNGQKVNKTIIIEMPMGC